MSAIQIPRRGKAAPAPQPSVPSVAPTPPDPYAHARPDSLFEVVQGKRVEKAMGVYEQYLGVVLHHPLMTHCLANDLGRALAETMFAIPRSGNDRKPDVAFVSYQRWAKDRNVPRVNAWPVAPDLVAEVVSPSDEMFAVLGKVEEYFAGGVRQVWLLFSHIDKLYRYASPTDVRILTRDDELDGDPVVPGFRLALSALFPAVAAAGDAPAADA